MVKKNTISSAQEKQNGEYSMLLHNEYLKEKKEKILIVNIKLW
jgi:adenine/guanine phosphoribosyltransferase-like PRPP-binding protein